MTQMNQNCKNQKDSKLYFEVEPISQALDSRYYKVEIDLKGLEKFKEILEIYKQNIQKHSTENAIASNALKPFLEKLGFETFVQESKKDGNSAIDLALMRDGSVEIIFELKKPNSNDMFNAQNTNAKSLAQAIYYYFRERKNHNVNLKFIILSDFYRFYIFKAIEFEKCFYKNKELSKIINGFESGSLTISKKEGLYKEIQNCLTTEKFFHAIHGKDLFDYHLNGIFFDIRKHKIQELYKIFHKNYLHCDFRPDANTINERFYQELLYIFGLKEDKDSKIIQDATQGSSFVKMLFSKLGKEDFDTAMGLIILWLNRILFLKIMETNLKSFDSDFEAFLDHSKIKDFETLSNLFFEVLNKDITNRQNTTPAFKDIPYFNSNLFKPHPLERNFLEIIKLDSSLKINYHPNTALRNTNNKKQEGQINFLQYLFDFLNAWNFKEIKDIQDSDKAMKKSILGLVFEKLNGYKEGSFYTPSFVTSHMCKTSLEKILIDKFSEFRAAHSENKAPFANIDSIFDYAKNFKDTYKDDFLKILQSLRVCDPAVGSGHFLVSMLNELIYIYHKLGLLDTAEVKIEVKNDDLIITLLKKRHAYTYQDAKDETQTHQLQKEIFHLKKQIIEQNLFGVDINQNSCNIAHLRLWLELLDSAYYKSKTKNQMETLPNIDINIKCGNSLISRFDIKDKFKTNNIKNQVGEYKNLVANYKNSSLVSRDDINQKIKNLKKYFTLELKDDKLLKKLESAVNKHFKNFSGYGLDDESLLQGIQVARQENIFQSDWELDSRQKDLAYDSANEIRKLRRKLDDIKSGAMYKGAFEWRFEFPEVLDSDGNFLGFDLIIGNPPYISTLDLTKSSKQSKSIYKSNYPSIKGSYDIFILFIILGLKISNSQNRFSWIIPNKFLIANYAKDVFDMLIEKKLLRGSIDVSHHKVFDNASVYPIIIYGGNNSEYKKYIVHTTSDLEKNNLTESTSLIDFKKYATLKESGIKIQTGLTGFQAHSICDFLSNGKQNDSIPFAVSGSIDRYFIDMKNVRYMNKQYHYPHITHNNAISKEKWNFWKNPKIIIAGMTKKLEAYYADSPLAIGVGAYAIYDFANFQPLFLLGILNSSFMNYAFVTIFKDKHLAGGYLGVNKNDLENLPIPKITESNKHLADEIIKIVEQILKLKEQDKPTNELESKIDSLVHQLYDLTTDEINIIES